MRALLEVNVLIALLDAAHVGHATATRWLAGQIEQGWPYKPAVSSQASGVLTMPARTGFSSTYRQTASR